MTVESSDLMPRRIFTCLSTDTKPTTSSNPRPSHNDLLWETDTGIAYIWRDGAWTEDTRREYVFIASRGAGDRAEDATDGSDYKEIAEGWLWVTVTFSGAEDQLVYDGACVLGRVISSAAIDVYVKDGATQQNTPLAMGAKGASDALCGTQCRTSATLNGSGAGSVSIQVRPLPETVTWTLS